jgi:hypothetical protein
LLLQMVRHGVALPLLLLVLAVTSAAAAVAVSAAVQAPAAEEPNIVVVADALDASATKPAPAGTIGVFWDHG